MTSGELLEVLATDPGAVADFAAWSRGTGNELVEQQHRRRRLPLRPAPEVRQSTMTTPTPVPEAHR